jgi:branched-chain amino acid aminotransferase
MNFVIINNQIIKEDQAFISVQERGFRFGDGVFETCRIVDGIIYNSEAHFARLKSGLEAIKIKIELHDLKNNVLNLLL